MKIKFAIDSDDVTTAVSVENLHEYIMEWYRGAISDSILNNLTGYCTDALYDNMRDEEKWDALDEETKSQILTDSCKEFIGEHFLIYELDTETKKIEYVG